MYSVLHMFPEEFPMLQRELTAGLYSTPVYYVARMIAQVSGLVLTILKYELINEFLDFIKKTETQEVLNIFWRINNGY